MNFEKNKDIVQQFEKLCEREGMNAADVLLWFMSSVVGADRLPVTAEDLEDWLLYHKAKAEYDHNPVTYTHEETKKLLEQDGGFDVASEEDLFYSPKNIERLKRAAAALNADEGVEHDIIEVDDDIDCSDEQWLTINQAKENFEDRKQCGEDAVEFMDSPERDNAELKAALEEVEQMKKDPSVGKAYTDVDEMMRELLS